MAKHHVNPSPKKQNAEAVEWFVGRILVQSRLVIIALGILADLLFPDHAADAFKSVPLHRTGAVDIWTQRILGGFFRWDGMHFLHIARHGYSYENSLAFFPLLPLLTRWITQSWHQLPCLGLLFSFDSALLLTFVALNFCAFVCAGFLLYHLTLEVMPDRRSDIALVTTFLYAVNPASIFFTAAYSESLYAFFTFLGLFLLYRRGAEQFNAIEASLCFGISLLCRSNGLLNAGYAGFVLLSGVIRRWLQPSPPLQRISEIAKRKLGPKKLQARPYGLFSSFLLILFSGTIILLPLLCHNIYAYRLFCVPARQPPPNSAVQQLAARMHYVMPGDLGKLSWCYSRPPTFYANIQAKYWNVGVLGYYQWRKIPLFLLALPVVSFGFRAVWVSLIELNLSRKGIWATLADAKSMLPFALHTLVLLLMGLFVINVEVTTRLLLCSCPLIYWYIAKVWIESSVHKEPGIVQCNFTTRNLPGFLLEFWRQTCRLKQNRALLICYLLWSFSYAIIGTCLYVNFLPWT